MFHFSQNWRLWFYQCLIVFVLSISVVHAQESKRDIIVTGEHDKLERSLSQPKQYLQRVGLSKEQIVKQLGARPRINVSNAGATFSAELAETLVRDSEILTKMDILLTRAQRQLNSQVRIHVNNAGFTSDSGLQAFTDLQQADAGILVVGAGSVRLMYTDQITSTELIPVTELSIHVKNAGSARNLKSSLPGFQ